MAFPLPAAPRASASLVRISEVFDALSGEIIEGLGPKAVTPLGHEYHLLKGVEHVPPSRESAPFIRWAIPVHHSWPCCPQKTEGFIEKAAQALYRKFGNDELQTILVGVLDPTGTNRYYKTLASNLRGRMLQLFGRATGKAEPEELDPAQPVLFCMVGQQGLFCGLQSPREANGFFPGGTRYIRQNSPGAISRAGAKIAEALHYLRLYGPKLEQGSHWLELGASPGGMTWELLQRGFKVTAVDRAALDPRLDRASGLHFYRGDVSTFEPQAGVLYDALLSDMNGSAEDSITHVARLASWLRSGGIVVFTLKTSDAGTKGAVDALFERVVDFAAGRELSLIAATHLTYNRQEFTLFFRKNA